MFVMLLWIDPAPLVIPSWWPFAVHDPLEFWRRIKRKLLLTGDTTSVKGFALQTLPPTRLQGGWRAAVRKAALEPSLSCLALSIDQDKVKFKNLFYSGALKQCWIELRSLPIELNDLYSSGEGGTPMSH
jgi:hypothetical protein